MRGIAKLSGVTSVERRVLLAGARIQGRSFGFVGLH